MQRKVFIRDLAIGMAVTIVPRHVIGGKGFLAPSDRICLGYIGGGKMGLGLLESMNRCPETLVSAACDVDAKKLDRLVAHAVAANRKKIDAPVSAYRHYRELLDRKDIDAMVVATPDHWHAQIAIDAAKAGKDIYCEKPLALTIAEGRAMVEAVRKYKRVLQTGSMQRSQHNFRHAVELIRNGYIGAITEINVEIGEPVKQCDLPTMPIPDYLDWNMWVGPSLYRGYHPTLCPPIEDNSWAWWRGYRGFGGGMISDWGAHMFDIVQWALDMDESGPIEYIPPDIPGAVRGLSFRYADGVVVNHQDWGGPNAIQFVGAEGKIEVSRTYLRSNPPSLVERKITDSEKRVYYSDNHYQDWIDAVKKRSKPVADVEVGHRTVSICNAANIAYELQRKLQWDPKRERFNDSYANLMLTRPYRGSWDYLDF